MICEGCVSSVLERKDLMSNTLTGTDLIFLNCEVATVHFNCTESKLHHLHCASESKVQMHTYDG